MLEIIPAILTNNINEAEDEIQKCTGIVKRVQLDIIDGIFADNKTIDPSNLGEVESSLALDFHLMVKSPIKWVEKSINAGADRIIGQVEMMESQIEFIQKIQFSNLRVGLALDLATPVSVLDPAIFPLADVILLMSVKAGFGGQKFDKSVLTKIKELNEIRVNGKSPFKICVDGGETDEVIDDTYLAGADEVVIGNRLFVGDLEVNIKKLLNAAEK